LGNIVKWFLRHFGNKTKIVLGELCLRAQTLPDRKVQASLKCRGGLQEGWVDIDLDEVVSSPHQVWFISHRIKEGPPRHTLAGPEKHSEGKEQ
jgi:hypothetical protein